MALSNMTCQAAKPKIKPYKLADGEGLYLEVTPAGNKYWRLKYRLLGKEKRISIGAYPAISIADARKAKEEIKKDLRSGFDPVLRRIQSAQAHAFNQQLNFKSMALEWHSRQVQLWKPKHAEIIKHRFEKYVFPDLGNFPLSDIKPMMVLGCLQKIEKSAPDLSRRIKGMCGHVFKYAIATGRAENDPTYGLEAAMKRFKRGHYASISVDEFPEFSACLKGYENRVNRQTFLALKLLLLTFVRTSELVEARWGEINFENAMWLVPAERMKMNLPHLVPLSRQSLSIFLELKELNVGSDFIFPGYYDRRRHMSKNTMLIAIRRMGYAGRMTGHGFRSLALGILKEKLSYTHDIADRQLAHVPKSGVDRAYDRAQFLQQRKKMMQEYADYVENASK
ncbi:integrase arm-type DNA-binding domain-containing protein [Dyadobacter sp. LJ53]|uniref:tyrosine-type recombinase/integrase n=1 Tax=Dyadobacter chenwenxiniae TaxID=2906456 RepID=UPI001F408D0D|nr:integrase arm-type DNA-binding domain-containing protein [Dyadobacter chenwenxiniae]MCF0049549.1 integrase arm-type DNA-binding domain-containing protein [Dyadobacter chenwenxiniae]